MNSAFIGAGSVKGLHYCVITGCVNEVSLKNKVSRHILTYMMYVNIMYSHFKLWLKLARRFQWLDSWSTCPLIRYTTEICQNWSLLFELKLLSTVRWKTTYEELIFYCSLNNLELPVGHIEIPTCLVLYRCFCSMASFVDLTTLRSFTCASCVLCSSLLTDLWYN